MNYLANFSPWGLSGTVGNRSGDAASIVLGWTDNAGINAYCLSVWIE